MVRPKILSSKLSSIEPLLGRSIRSLHDRKRSPREDKWRWEKQLWWKMWQAWVRHWLRLIVLSIKKKKKNQVKNVITYTKSNQHSSPNSWICHHQLKCQICSKYIFDLWTLKNPFSDLITTTIAVKSGKLCFLELTNML